MIKIGDNFDYRGPNPNFSRDAFQNKDTMDATTTGIDKGHISYCHSEKTYYKFNGTTWERVIDTDLNDTSENPVQNSVITGELKKKADKVTGTITTGNFAGLDENGNLTDSGYSASSFASSQGAVNESDILNSWDDTDKKMLSADLGKELNTRKSYKKEIQLSAITTSIDLTDGVVVVNGNDRIKLIEKTGDIALGIGKSENDIVLYSIDLNTQVLTQTNYKDLRDWVGKKGDLSEDAIKIVSSNPRSLVSCVNELSKDATSDRSGLMSPGDKSKYDVTMVGGKDEPEETDKLTGNLSDKLILGGTGHPFIGQVTSLRGNKVEQLLGTLKNDSCIEEVQSKIQQNDGKSIKCTGNEGFWGIHINNSNLIKLGNTIRILASLDSREVDPSNFGLFYKKDSEEDKLEVIELQEQDKIDRYKWFEHTINESETDLYFGCNVSNLNLSFFIEQIEIFKGSAPTSKQYVPKGLHGTRFDKLIVTSYDILDPSHTPCLSKYKLNDAGTVTNDEATKNDKVYFVPVKSGWTVNVKNMVSYGFSYVGYNETPNLITTLETPNTTAGSCTISEDGYLLVYSSSNTTTPRVYLDGAGESAEYFYKEIDLHDIGELRKYNDDVVDSFTSGLLERKVYESAENGFEELQRSISYNTSNPDHGCQFPIKYVITPVWSGAEIKELKYEVSNKYQTLMEENLVDEYSGENEKEFIKKADIVQPSTHIARMDDALYAANERFNVTDNIEKLFDGDFSTSIDNLTGTIKILKKENGEDIPEIKNLILSFKKAPQYVPKIKVSNVYLNGEIIEGELGGNAVISYSLLNTINNPTNIEIELGEYACNLTEIGLIPADSSPSAMVSKYKQETFIYSPIVPDTEDEKAAANVGSAKPYMFELKKNGSNFETINKEIGDKIIEKYDKGCVVIGRYYEKDNTSYSFIAHRKKEDSIYFLGKDDEKYVELRMHRTDNQYPIEVKYSHEFGITSITCQELRTLCDSSLLDPGHQYRITDYTCKIDSTIATSAGHKFDIIVTADSKNKLNENARAVRNESDGGYFADSNLAAWELKYCLDASKSNCNWVSSESSEEGVIYYMKDEFGNECPYDFKNITYYGGDVKYYTYSYLNTRQDEIKDASVCSTTKGRVTNNIISEYRNLNNQVVLNEIIMRIRDSHTNEILTNNRFFNCYNFRYGDDIYSTSTTSTKQPSCINNQFIPGDYNGYTFPTSASPLLSSLVMPKVTTPDPDILTKPYRDLFG